MGHSVIDDNQRIEEAANRMALAAATQDRTRRENRVSRPQSPSRVDDFDSWTANYEFWLTFYRRLLSER